MKRIIFILALATSLVVGAQNFTISGSVKDAISGQTLPLASVKVLELNKGVSTDFSGNYTISLPKGSYTLEFSYVGFKPEQREITLDKNLTITVSLSEEAKQLKEVVITVEKRDANVEQVEMSSTKLEIEEIKKMPAFMGEVDVVKSIQLLPGVTTVGEGASGFNVRGGAIDQNLILMDNAPVYSSSHLFGFFSVFNSDALEDVKLYKGSIPAPYGGRISSVLDVHQKSADMNKFHASGGLGVVSSRLTIEAPIVKNKLSLIVGGRRSYADIFLKASPDSAINSTAAYFYDLNGKLAYKVNENNKITLSGYHGVDVLNFQDLFGFKWGNTLASLNWVHTINDSTFIKTYGSYSRYNYQLEFSPIFVWTSIIDNMDLGVEFHKDLGKHDIRIGFKEKLYAFQPAILEEHPDATEDFAFPTFSIDRENALETGIYIGDEIKFSDKFSMMAGVRYSQFTNFGPGETYVYEEGQPKNANTLYDTTTYAKNEVQASYGGFEPRFGMRFKLNESSSVKAGYNRMRQYLHLISNSTSGLPIDVWKMTDEYIKPLIGDQVAAGYFKNFKNDTIEFSAEVYYKWMTNVVDYKNGAELLLNENVETELLTGTGRAYGIELMLKKSLGDLTGWISYTLSRTERKVAESEFQEEIVNEGNWYPSNYDKTHDLTLVLSYEITKRLSVSSNFTYSTGRAITYPDSKFQYDNKSWAYYPTRNQDRLSPYNRLDLSVTLKGKENPEKKFHSEWVLSVYNVYARRNPFALIFTENEETGETEAQRISILGTVLPAITYNFNF